MKTWHGYSLLDFILISVGFLAIVFTSIFLDVSWYLIINALLAIFCVFTQAKGKVITQFLGLIWSAFYIYIAYKFHYYGEVILTIVAVIPMYIYGIIHWLKNKKGDSDEVVIRQQFSKKEWLALIIGLAVGFVVIYFLLKALNTAQLLISTASFILLLLAMYMLIRRHKWNLVPFLLQDIINPLFWIPVIVAGQTGYVIMLIHLLFQIIYDIYGTIEWNKKAKAQKEKQVVEQESNL